MEICFMKFFLHFTSLLSQLLYIRIVSKWKGKCIKVDCLMNDGWRKKVSLSWNLMERQKKLYVIEAFIVFTRILYTDNKTQTKKPHVVRYQCEKWKTYTDTEYGCLAASKIACRLCALWRWNNKTKQNPIFEMWTAFLPLFVPLLRDSFDCLFIYTRWQLVWQIFFFIFVFFICQFLALARV